MFQLIFRPTKREDKFAADDAHFMIGDRESVFRIWWELKQAGWPHVEIYNMAGTVQQPEQGIAGLRGVAG